MKCEHMPEHLIALLYNELGKDQEKNVQKHLKTCTQCQKTFQELQSTTRLLNQWEDLDPKFNHVFMNEPLSPLQSMRARISHWGLLQKLTYGIPAFCAVTILFLAIINFKTEYKQGQWNFSVGILPSSSRQKVNTELVDDMTEIQKETLIMVAQMMEEYENQQNNNLNVKLAQLSQSLERQRRQDLLMVGQGLEGLHLSTEGKYYETRTMLNDLIKLTSAESNQ